MKNIRAASVQFECAAGDKAKNLVAIERFAAEAHRRGVELIAFPECCVTGYWFLRKLSREALEALAEPAYEGPSCRTIRELSMQFGMTIGAGFIEKGEDGALYNSYLAAMPDGSCRRHRKLHAFVSEYLASGSEFTVFDDPHGCRIGVLICYDNNIIENARINALMGVDILLAPHQTGGCDSISPHAMKRVDRELWDKRKENPQAIAEEFRGPKGRGWLMRWLPSRAHDNGFFLLFSNGVGVDDDEIRTGNAMILDPYGRILAETSKTEDDMVITDLDASLLDQCTGRRWLQARRPELYSSLAQATGDERDARSVRFGLE
ncbi:MAG: nitrilase family protein [Candidatus Omnitrophota bacterium]